MAERLAAARSKLLSLERWEAVAMNEVQLLPSESCRDATTWDRPSRPTCNRFRLAFLPVRIDRITINRLLQNEPTFSQLFMSHLVTRNVRIQEDLIDQLFHSAEKRLARTLLLLAHFGEEGNSEPVIPKISQETLAEMVGTTRSRVSFFMNRFKRLGCITCTDGLRVHRSLLNVVLSS